MKIYYCIKNSTLAILLHNATLYYTSKRSSQRVTITAPTTRRTCNTILKNETTKPGMKFQLPVRRQFSNGVSRSVVDSRTSGKHNCYFPIRSRTRDFVWLFSSAVIRRRKRRAKRDEPALFSEPPNLSSSADKLLAVDRAFFVPRWSRRRPALTKQWHNEVWYEKVVGSRLRERERDGGGLLQTPQLRRRLMGFDGELADFHSAAPPTCRGHNKAKHTGRCVLMCSPTPVTA